MPYFLIIFIFDSGVDTSRCVDWTTTRRAGYKPGSNESTEPEYTATRGSNSKKGSKLNKTDSKKKSAGKTKNTNASTTHQ
jgi:hypothetical protein